MAEVRLSERARHGHSEPAAAASESSGAGPGVRLIKRHWRSADEFAPHGNFGGHRTKKYRAHHREPPLSLAVAEVRGMKLSRIQPGGKNPVVSFQLPAQQQSCPGLT